jgi:diguanylate cyclase (GGDEF)-like protein/PAS domain S-box-containing protein
MAVEDLDRRFVQVNPALCTLVERQSEWMRSHRVPDVLDAEEDRRDLQCRAQLLSGEVDSILRESRLVRADGSRIWVEHSIGILRDETGNPLSYVSTFENVTEAKRANEKLRYQATHDSLTHLINRRELFNQAEKLLSYTQRSGNRVGALYLDVDNLKVINDTYGHTVGDRVLIEVAERLSSVGRSDDIVSRVGGDEFAILLPALHSVEDAERVAKKILAAFSDPVVFEDREIIVTVSIGVALAEPDFSIDDTLKHADLALNRAKRDGRSNSKVYVSGLD